MTTSPALGMFFFIKMPGSRHGQSSSPVMISVGTVSVFILSTRSNSDGRRFCTPRIVSAEPSVECSPAARILVLVLHARRTERVGFGRLFHRQFLKTFCGCLSLLGKLSPLAWCRAIAATCNHNRAATVGIGKSEMKRGKSAHRKPDNVRFVDLESIQHGPDVVSGALLRIALAILGDIGRRISARVERHAAIIFREMANLLLVGAIVAGKFMDKNDRDAFDGFFIVELDPVIGRQMWHAFLIQKAWARAERPASMVTTAPLV